MLSRLSIFRIRKTAYSTPLGGVEKEIIQDWGGYSSTELQPPRNFSQTKKAPNPLTYT